MSELNEYDITKKMLNTIRENVNQNTNDQQSSNNTQNDVIELSGEERSSQEKKFRELVDSSAQFNVFNVYPKANNVVFGGMVQGMGGIEFQMTLEDTNGLYISGDNIQITDEVSDKIKKLKAFYDGFKDEWYQKLASEYKSKQ